MTATRLIPITSRTGVIAYALVDEADFAQLSKHSWCLNRGRAVRRGPLVDGKQTMIYMHREVLGLGYGDEREGDHINHIRTDNRRANLRIVTRAQNLQNQIGGHGVSGRRGVSYHAGHRMWRARMMAGGKEYSRYFATLEEAVEGARELRLQHMTHTVEAVSA